MAKEIDLAIDFENLEDYQKMLEYMAHLASELRRMESEMNRFKLKVSLNHKSIKE